MKRLTMVLTAVLLGWAINLGLFADRGYSALEEATFVVG
jgi:preprotein translocase subunit SecG